MTSHDLMVAGLFVQKSMQHDSELEKTAQGATKAMGRGALEIGKRLVGGAAGTGAVIGAGTSAMGKELSKQLGGGVLGGAGHLAMKAAPYVGGAAALNYVAGDPAGYAARHAMANYKARMLAQQAAYDPSSGVMY